MYEKKVTIKEFAEETDFPGLKHITSQDAHLVKRVLWTLIVLISFAVLIQSVAIAVQEYLAFEHVSKYDVTFLNRLTFPSVTVCNVNKVRVSAITQDDLVEMGPHLKMIDSNFSLINAEQYPQHWVNATFLQTNWTSVITNHSDNFTLEEFMNRTGHQFETMVQHCKWQQELCNRSSWTTQFTHYGKCYTFNKNGDHLLEKAGSGNGLTLILDTEEDEYLSTVESDDLGFKFQVHSSWEPPFLKEIGYGVYPGVHYLVGMRQKQVVGLPAPYGECVEDYQMDYFSNYTVSACRIECETKKIFENCGCRLVESPGGHPVCQVEEYDCAQNTLDEIEQSDQCLCKTPCNSVQYPFLMSFLDLRQDTIDLLRKEHPIPPHLTADNLLTLTIYFDSLSYESVEQTPSYTVHNVLSDLGGNLGLWIGASIISLVHWLDYWLTACLRACHNRRARRVSHREVKAVKLSKAPTPVQ